jgi:hypothetical protein
MTQSTVVCVCFRVIRVISVLRGKQEKSGKQEKKRQKLPVPVSRPTRSGSGRDG